MAPTPSLTTTSSLVALLLATAVTHAEPITITHAGRGAGRLAGVDFANRTFTITAYGDTTARVLNQTNSPDIGYDIPHFAAVIDIEGLGSYSILTPICTFVNQQNRTAGLSRWHEVHAGLDLFHSAIASPLASWNMLTSIGPINSPGRLLQWDRTPVINTTGGVLEFSSATGVEASFSAIVVPAPAAATLLLTLIPITRRRRR